MEEVASFFGAMLYTEHAENPTFQENFFKDFAKIAKRHKTVRVPPPPSYPPNAVD